MEKEQQNIEEAYRNLENSKEAHNFHRTNVTPIHLTQSEQTDFQYNRLKVVATVRESLKENLDTLDAARAKIHRAKSKFRAFCRQHITDRQLQETAIEGMETKETYEEILDYHKNMSIRLDNANRIAQDYISHNDQQIQACINNRHNHLTSVTTEFRVSPQKNRVRVADKHRFVWQFTIPEWEVEVG